jgi:hypothetical protein
MRILVVQRRNGLVERNAVGDIGADPKRVEILPARPVLPARPEPAPDRREPAPAKQPAPAS